MPLEFFGRLFVSRIKPQRNKSAIYDALRTGNKSTGPTDKQRLFARTMAQPGMNPYAAARSMGMRHNSSVIEHWKKDADVQALIQAERAAYAEASKMTKKRVVDGFLRAVELAELKTDSIAMTAAWREVGRMCGFYAPKIVQHQISLNGQALKDKLHSMSEDELLKLANGEEEEANVLEGEFLLVGKDPTADAQPEGESDSSQPENIKDDLTSVR